MPVTSGELILRPSRRKVSLLLLLSLAFTVGGVFMVLDDQGLKGWFVFGVFGLCSGVFAVQSLPNASWLRLSAEGFRFRTLYRTSRVFGWKDVGPFSVARMPDNKMVVFDSENLSKSRLAPLNRAIAGASGGLPDTYGMSAEELARLLNEWRERRL